MNIFGIIQELDMLGGSLDSLLYTLDSIFRTITILMIIPSLLNCFFGYKIQKFFITLGGVVVGGIIGMLVGALSSGESVVVVLAALLFAVLGGFLAFKLYRVGLFITFWLYGTVLFAALFLVNGAYEMIPTAVVLGLIVGVLALVLHKGFVICTTAICGGMPAGMSIGSMAGSPALGFLLGVGLSALGIFVQFRLEKKEGAVSTQNAAAAAGPVAPNGFAAAAVGAEQPAATVAVAQQPAVPVAPEYRFQLLGTTVPTTYCPRSGVLTERYSLFKDGNEDIFAAIDFRNVGKKPVIAIYYTLLCRSVGGDELGSMERVLLDINVAPGEGISGGEPFRLTDHMTRLIDVRLTQVVTADGESIRLTEENTKPLPLPRELRRDLSPELLELAGIREDERYFLTELENDLWICTCGTIAGEACPQCGRTRSGVLRDNGNDIYVRIDDRVRAELSRSENLTARRELAAARDAISRNRKLMQNCENLKELAEDCDSVLKSIDERLSEITSREEKAKKKAFRYALLAAAVAGCAAVLALIITSLRGLPPSDSRILKDMTADFTERYGNCRITDSEIEELSSGSGKNRKVYQIELWGEDKTFHDKLYVSAKISYQKEHGVFRLYGIDDYVPFITPADPPSPSDTYTGLTVGIKGDGSVIVISDYGDGWKPLSDWVEPSELSYSSELDYANAKINENTARIPVSFRASYRNEEGGLDSAINYIYLGNRVWQADTLEPRIELHLRDDVVLTHEGLAGVIKNKTIQYEEDTLSCEYLMLSNERTTYTEGGQHAKVSANFVWNDGQGSFGGTLTMELNYTDGGWHAASVSCLEAGHPTANAAMSGDQAAELLRAAIEKEGIIAGEFVELSVDGVQEQGGFADLTAHYVAREGEYLRTTMVKGRYEYHAGKGYQPDGMLSYSGQTLLPEQEISASLSVNYRLNTSDATPVGVAGSGVAQADVNIHTSGAAIFKLNIGGLRVNLSGSISGQAPTFSCSGAQQKIMTRYVFIIRLEGELAYNVSGTLRYENGTLSGTIVFDSVGIGVDGFSVTLGD